MAAAAAFAQVQHVGTKAEAADWLRRHPVRGKQVLVKGSCSLALETLVELLWPLCCGRYTMQGGAPASVGKPMCGPDAAVDEVRPSASLPACRRLWLRFQKPTTTKSKRRLYQ